MIILILPLKPSTSSSAHKCVYMENRMLTTDVFVRAIPDPATVLASNDADFQHKCRSLTSHLNGNYHMLSASLHRSVRNHANGPTDASNLSVYIYDFSLTSEDVYIDLDLLQHSQKAVIITLVARQFVTFNLYVNLGEAARQSQLQRARPVNLTVLLNGDCSLQIIQTSEASSSMLVNVNVLHAPMYDQPPMDMEDHVDSSSSSDATRKKWIAYLSRMFVFDVYEEHLTMLCRMKSLRVVIDSSQLTPPATTGLVQFTEYDFEADRDFIIMRKCIPITAATTRRTFETTRNDCQQQSPVFILEFDRNNNVPTQTRGRNDENGQQQHIRLFLKDCDKSSRHNLVLYYNRSAFCVDNADAACKRSNRSFTLDLSRCANLNILYVIFVV
jgi:hypothetical protein